MNFTDLDVTIVAVIILSTLKLTTLWNVPWWFVFLPAYLWVLLLFLFVFFYTKLLHYVEVERK